MINPKDNHTEAVAILQPDTDERTQVPATSAPTSAAPLFATRGKQPSKNQFSQNKTVLIGTGAVIFALLLFAFTSAQRHQHVQTRKAIGAVTHPTAASQSGDNADSQKSFTPVTDAGRSTGQDVNNGHIDEKDVQHTATSHSGQVKGAPAAKIPPGATLGSLPPFDNAPGAWQAPPYQPTNNGSDTNDLPKPEKETDQPSLVFVQKATPANSSKMSDEAGVEIAPGLGLPIGTRLRARLEVAASTAVRTPVIAVVEYNYEKDGEIIVPAGAKAFGHIEQADHSGYLSVRFESLLLPDGASTAIDAVATDLSLRPLKGKVEGKNTGKNVVVRSLSGIGQVGALLAGRGGSLSQPFSESDLIRERLSTNIGETADQEVTRLSLSEHVVVSLSANTPIYVVLDRGTKLDINHAQSPVPSAPPPQNLESLRQLLQLQRELNQTTETNPRP